MALDQAKAEKKAELRRAAEEAYYAVFAGEGLIPGLARDYVLSIAPRLGAPLAPGQLQQVRDAGAVVDKLRTKLAALDAAKTEPEVRAVSW